MGESQGGTTITLALRTLSASTDHIISSLPSHLKALIHLSLRRNPRHRLRPQGTKKEKGPGKGAACGIGSIGIANMSYDWPRLAAVGSIAIPCRHNAVMRCIGRAFIHFAVYLHHSGLNYRSCLRLQFACRSCLPRDIPVINSRS
jgi:hypothetical protein